ncbi:MAG: ATP synthase F1 subunit gamma [Candidatus Pacebacteria bacterium]|nr:ATP synthase F1 subunit gamma [Candidatus Paceibacterota bacterium]
MQSTQQIRRQIQSTQNTSQITKAMEMVAASKMKKSQQAALLARPYAEAALNILQSVSESVEPTKHCLLENRKVQNLCLVVVTSDKGLCGGFNGNVLRETQKIVDKNKDKNISIIAIGKKAETYFKKRNEISAVFNGIGDTVELRETLPISKLLINEFTAKKYDKITAVYNNYISTIKQDVKVKKLLPITRRSLEETVEEIQDLTKNEYIENNGIDYTFEPSASKVLCALLPNLVETQVYHVVLESNASEHSARMVAMKNATDNAKEMLTDLKLLYNYIRQQKITQEISEISAGVAAQE